MSQLHTVREPRSCSRLSRLIVATAITIVLVFIVMSAPASAADWITTRCTTPEQAMCVESVESKANGTSDASYAADPDLSAVAQPYNVWSGDGWVVHLVRPQNPYQGRVYAGPPQCQSRANGTMFLSVSASEAYCRDLVAATRNWAPGSPLGSPAIAPAPIASVEGRTVRVRVRMGAFVPRYGVVIGSGRGDIPETSVPNRTWTSDSSSGQNVLSVVLKPEPTDGLIVGSEFCSFASGCDGGPANWRGVMTYAFFGDFTKFTYPELARGMTVFTNAFRYDSLKVDAAKRAVSLQIAGPHVRMDGTTNTAFAGVFIPEALANSPVGFGLPSSDAEIGEKLRAFRDGSQTSISAAITRAADGKPTGVYGEVTGITFSAPTYEFRGPDRAAEPPVAKPAAPRKPSGKFSINKKKRIVTALINPEAGAAHSIKATQARGSAGAKKKSRAKVGKCVAVKKTKKVSCSVKLAKGRWLVSVVASRSGLTSPVLAKAVKVR